MADMTAAQQKAALAKGQAIKNSSGQASFPIKTRADLDKAIRAVGRVRPNTEQARSRVRRYIIGRAKAIGASDAIPPTWQADGSLNQ